jgi:hypothetical protein
MDRRASEWERQRDKEIAAAVLDGQTTAFEAVRELCPLAHTEAIADEEMKTIEHSSSQLKAKLTALLWRRRKPWVPYSLDAKDAEIARVEELLQSAIP